MITIQKGIPIPSSKSRRWKDTISSMEPGDSFVVDSADHYNAVTICARNLGLRVTSRREEGGIRIWVVGNRKATS